MTKSFISCLTDLSTVNERIEPDSELHALASTIISTQLNTTDPDAHGDNMGFDITKPVGSSPAGKNGTRFGASKRLVQRKNRQMKTNLTQSTLESPKLHILHH